MTNFTVNTATGTAGKNPANTLYTGYIKNFFNTFFFVKCVNFGETYGSFGGTNECFGDSYENFAGTNEDFTGYMGTSCEKYETNMQYRNGKLLNAIIINLNTQYNYEYSRFYTASRQQVSRLA
jgi:hypothetical protein